MKKEEEKGFSKNWIIIIIAIIALAVGLFCLYNNYAPPKFIHTNQTNLSGLQIVFKDPGLPEVKYLRPIIKAVQLQKENQEWVTIWTSSDGQAMTLTTDGVENILDIVNVPAGVYMAARLLVSKIDVLADINRDGDSEDQNVEVVLTEAEFNSLPARDKPSAPSQPSAPSAPSAPEKPSAPSAPSGPESQEQPSPPSAPSDSSGPSAPSPPSEPSPPTGAAITGAATEDQSPPSEPSSQSSESSEPSAPSEPSKPSEPSQPSAPAEPTPPVRIENGLVYTGEFLDEQHTVSVDDYMTLQLPSHFSYDGKGGKIIFDFSLHPTLPKHQQISLEVSVLPGNKQ